MPTFVQVRLIRINMPGILLLISTVSTLLFALVVLIKLGVPAVFAFMLAMAVGFVWWRFEKNDTENEKQGWADYLVTLMDIKDIFKYVGRLF